MEFKEDLPVPRSQEIYQITEKKFHLGYNEHYQKKLESSINFLKTSGLDGIKIGILVSSLVLLQLPLSTKDIFLIC